MQEQMQELFFLVKKENFRNKEYMEYMYIYRLKKMRGFSIKVYIYNQNKGFKVVK